MDCYKNIQEDLNFNPRSREGSDTWMPSKRNGMSDFNPRSREGSDAAALLSRLQDSDFNPRSREGSDDL